jgi:hypothetical protein
MIVIEFDELEKEIFDDEKLWKQLERKENFFLLFCGILYEFLW